jgi:hypothetical protein
MAEKSKNRASTDVGVESTPAQTWLVLVTVLLGLAPRLSGSQIGSTGDIKPAWHAVPWRVSCGVVL